MKVMVFDVPAESGGALTILNQYYSEAVKAIETDWVFIVSTPNLKETKNVQVLNFPWIKKSWIHRLFFDYFVAHKLVKKYNVDEVLSLQNIVIPRVKVKQTLYLHQLLPFTEIKFTLLKNIKFWVYQNIIGKMIIQSIRKADIVIVQTKWVMNAASEKAIVKKEKFIIKQPELNIVIKDKYDPKRNNENVFFYPAGASIYKNHEVIVKACLKLKYDNISNYKVIFTLTGNESNHIVKLYNLVKANDLPINFIGSISINQVYEYYSKSILIFPSYIETFGLPLLEAKLHECPIIASDMPFSHEILDDYDKVYFFNYDEYEKLAKEINRLRINND